MTLRSAGSSGMLPPVLSSGQGWCAVCQRVRRVHPFLLRSLWRTALFGFSGCSFFSLFMWEVLALSVYPSCVQYLDHAGVPITGHPLGRRWEHYLRGPLGTGSPLKALAGKVDRVVPTTGAQQSTFKSSG